MMLDQDVAPAEKKQLEQLRSRFQGEMNEEMFSDDNLFLRFLRARNSLNASEEMLRNHLHWRKVNNIDTLIKEYKPREVLLKFFPLTSLGLDNDGCPIVYIEYGNLDVRGLYKCVKVSDVEKFTISYLEEQTAMMKKQTKKLGRLIDKWVCIFNYENFTLANATNKNNIDLLIHLIKMYDGNYPERLKTAYLINASFYFTLCWTLLTPFVAPATHQKIKIFGKEGWQDELRKNIRADTLPTYLGGSRTDPNGDPRCNTIVNHGGEIPKSYHLHKDRDSFTKLPGVKRLVINRRARADVRLDVPEAGSIIEWTFDVKHRDICFSLCFKGGPSGEDELVPQQKVDTELYSESGILKCEKAGTYILRFDNTFSWLHGKEVFYFANILTPQDSKK